MYKIHIQCKNDVINHLTYDLLVDYSNNHEDFIYATIWNKEDNNINFLLN